MRVRQTLLIATLVSMISPMFAAQAAGITYRWVDADGNLQLSDTLPPRAASQGYKVLDPSSGRVLREVAPQKTEQQRAREQAERQAAQQQQQAAREQARRDRVLQSLYGSEEDIKRVRDERLDRMDGRIRQMEGSIERMEAAIAAGHGDEQYKRDLKKLRQSLEETRTERRDMAERYESDLQRFRELQRQN
ncbi:MULTISPECIES: DUF4124 domain-containing protein [unclassified Guyparkeria]|uniref:DUF4124 domain-containing protein n=1 Tax=unclassified Guyparkeria TaxID=2626246 RepID=UPI0007337FF1|nr:MULTISPECIES: DUF4124 domain-containing protein [unclassified Guyparkeria]KTG16644.1 hypothetical protein AUR63_00850 [Guyparkeria sp. XI15]OAE85678.1 hypothetical protein AWR35_00850 [Guyparkeria sp. WRN-7]